MKKTFALTIILLLTFDFSFGQHTLYNKNKQPTKEGTFKTNRLWDGKSYTYDKDDNLVKIEFYKNGEFVRDSIVQPKEKVHETGLVYYEKTQRVDTNEIYIFVDSVAKFKKGTSDLMKYVMTNFVYPKDQESLQTKAVIKFVVNRQGVVTNAVIYNKIPDKYTLFDKEMLRVFNSMFPWTPAIKNGTIVKQELTIPVQLEIR
jgi:TonB family protein